MQRTMDSTDVFIVNEAAGNTGRKTVKLRASWTRRGEARLVCCTK